MQRRRGELKRGVFRGPIVREHKETLEGGLRIDRWWWVLVKAGTLVVTSALIGIGMALAFL